MQHVDTISLIRRLKQQPRHGSTVNDFLDWVRSTGTAVSSLGEVEQAILDTTLAMESLAEKSAAIVSGYAKQNSINTELAKSFKEVASQMLFLEKRNSSIQKSMGVSWKTASALSMEYAKLANNLGTTHMQMIKYGGSIKNIAPMMNQANASTNNYMKGLVAVQHVLTTNLGLTEQQAEEYSYFAAQTGQNAAAQLDLQNQMMKTLDPKGEMGYFKTITEGIASATADIQIGFGRIPGNLEVAVLKGKALGLTLADLKRTGETLLNIESSIGDELEYQLLSGHRLLDDNKQSLTNKYREAMLQGDMSAQANTLNTILEKEGKTLKNNLFARQQMAKLLGMDEASLSRALQKKEILEKSTPEAKVLMNLSGDEFKQQAEALRKQGDLTDAAYKELMTLQDNRTQEEILDQILNVGLDQSMTQLLSLKQLELMTTADETITDAAKKQTEAFVGWTETQLEQVGGDRIRYAAITNTARSRNDLYSAETNDQIGTPIVSNDLIATPTGYGDRILLAGEDTFALNNNDTIVAGTNLLPGGSSTNDDGKLAATMMQVGHMIVSALNRKSKNELFGEGMNPSKWS
jgi:hypothetical protein